MEHTLLPEIDYLPRTLSARLASSQNNPPRFAQIPYFIFMVSNPCCPNKISFMNEKIPNQTTGVISTPNAGGTVPLTSRSRGSVGHTMMLKGTSLTLAEGYHERTMRHS